VSSAKRQEACETFAEQAFTAAADAYMRTSGSWATAVHAALAGLLDYLAASPLTHRCLVEDGRGGIASLERRDRALERFADFLEPGFEESDHPPPEIVSEAIGGAVYELLCRRVAEGRSASLPQSLPELTVLTLSPFVGGKEAHRLAARPIPLRVDG
jgi:hypothetical protein